jgi:hypothetical protein
MPDEKCSRCGTTVNSDFEGINCEKCGDFICMDCQYHLGESGYCEGCFEELGE